MLLFGSSFSLHAQGRLVPFTENGKWGLKDSSGSVFAKPIFDTIVVVENLALVNVGGHFNNFDQFEGGKWGLITLEGKTLFEPKFDDWRFLGKDLFKVNIGGKWGLINSSGKIIIEPQFDFFRCFDVNDNIALVNIGGHEGEFRKPVGGKFGLITLEGKIIFKPKFDDILYEHRSSFLTTTEGCITTVPGFYKMENECWFVKTGGKWRLIDRSGKFFIEQKFDFVHFCGQGLFQVNIGGRQGEYQPVGGKWGLVNSKGILIAEPKFEEIDNFFFTAGAAKFKLNDKWGLINTAGKIILEPKFDFIREFHGDVAAVNIGGHEESGKPLGGKWGLIDTKGKIIIEPKFDFFKFFGGKVAAVNIGGHEESGKPVGGKWGLVSSSGKIIIEPKFEEEIAYSTTSAAEFRFNDQWGMIDTGYCFIKTHGKWGLIDRRGEFLIEPKFDFIPEFDRNSVFSGHRVARINMGGHQSTFSIVGGKWGIISTSGKIIIEPQFDFFRFLGANDSLALVNNGGEQGADGVVGGKWGIINCSGKLIIEPKFDFFRDFSGNVALVNIGGHRGENSPFDPVGGKWGLIDRSGKFIIEPKFDFCNDFNDDAWHFYAEKEPDNAEVYIGECDESGWPTDNGKWGLIDKTGKVIRFEK